MGKLIVSNQITVNGAAVADAGRADAEVARCSHFPRSSERGRSAEPNREVWLRPRSSTVPRAALVSWCCWGVSSTAASRESGSAWIAGSRGPSRL